MATRLPLTFAVQPLLRVFLNTPVHSISSISSINSINSINSISSISSIGSISSISSINSISSSISYQGEPRVGYRAVRGRRVQFSVCRRVAQLSPATDRVSYSMEI